MGVLDQIGAIVVSHKVSCGVVGDGRRRGSPGDVVNSSLCGIGLKVVYRREDIIEGGRHGVLV
jgi:hypothetical protein